jgi:hypothetical protein
LLIIPPLKKIWWEGLGETVAVEVASTMAIEVFDIVVEPMFVIAAC